MNRRNFIRGLFAAGVVAVTRPTVSVAEFAAAVSSPATTYRGLDLAQINAAIREYLILQLEALYESQSATFGRLQRGELGRINSRGARIF